MYPNYKYKNDFNESFSSFDRMYETDLKKQNKFEKIKNFLIRKKIYVIAGTIILIALLIIIIAASKGGKTEEKHEPISKYYSQRTINYLNLLSSLEKDNYIAYQYEFQSNSKSSFAKKYQYLYNYDTSLIPNNSEVGKYLFHKESYLKQETDEINYYKNILKKEPPKHYIYGPSFIKEEYNKGQKLYNPNVKLNSTKDWEGMTISLNIKHQPFMGNSNGGHIFGWGSAEWQKPGFFISLSYGILYFKQGKSNLKYDLEDAVKLGYDANNPEKRYLTNRPLTDEKWHQVIISLRKVTKEDEKYLTELNLKEGEFKSEVFIDGESRKNSTGNIMDDYGELNAFDLSNNSQMSHNTNYFIDNIIVLKKGINITEAKILYESIDQEVTGTPVLLNERCKIPGDLYGIKPDEVYPDSIYPFKAETKFFQFTSKWSCLGFSYEKFIIDRFKEFCSEHLKITDLEYLNGTLQYYQLENNYRYDISDVLRYYLPQINEKFKNLQEFKKYVKITSTNSNGKDKKSHTISNFGSWVSSEGLLQVNRFAKELGGIMRLPVANINYFAYFELQGGYVNNRIYTISVQNCEDIKFTYNDQKIISYAIKVNQVGYSPKVSEHYGYIGRWMGTFGKLSLSEYVGKPFKLMQNDKEVYTGTIEWRLKDDPKYYTSGIPTDLNGEETLSLNISNYKGTGENYYFYVEGIGISLKFSISYKGVFNAFYTHMKGLYNQRTGIEHKKPYTYWETPPHHKGIYVAHHIPNNYHYSSNYITDDSTGKGFCDFNQFEMIKETSTETYWEDVFGGHADAGDYDNRPYHLQMIDVLGCVFLLRKNILMDNQLNIPESNDNIPDILNEMEWGLQIHYLVQQKLNNGAVSTWIESTSHPNGLLDDGTDTARYYIGLSTREDTLRYVEAAGMLSICFKECDSCPQEKYEKWLKSAKWAFEWGIKEENRCKYSFKMKGRNLTYREPDVPEEIVARAALVLYRLTREEKYKQYIFKDITSSKYEDKYTNGARRLIDIRNMNPIDSFPIALFKDDSDFDLLVSKLNASIWSNTKTIINYQNNATQYLYRNAYFYKYDERYYSSLAWGAFTGQNQLTMLGVGLYLNEGKEVGDQMLQAISFFYDFELGCNHAGRTFTTNLGHHFPIHFVNHNNWWYNSKNIFDPIPGITLYTFFGDIETDAFDKFYKIQYAKNERIGFKGIDIPTCPSIFNLSEIPQNSTQTRNHLWGIIPFWRRMVNLEVYSIKSSEYTIYETIIKMALASGLLLGNDENVNQCHGIKDCPSVFPSEELKNKSPREDIKDLLGRWSIP